MVDSDGCNSEMIAEPPPKRICAAPDRMSMGSMSPQGSWKASFWKARHKLPIWNSNLRLLSSDHVVWKKKVWSLKTVVKHLRQKHLISVGCKEILSQTFSGASLDLMKRMTSGKGCQYPPELKSFALTLQFYSAKAYEFVRRTFNLALPHQSQIRRWY